MDPLHIRGHENGSFSCSWNKHKPPDDAHNACECHPLNSNRNDDPLYSVIKKNTTPEVSHPIKIHLYDHDGDPLFKTVIREKLALTSLKKEDSLHTSVKHDDSHNAVAHTDGTLYTTVNEIESRSSADKGKYPLNLPVHKEDRAGINVAQADSLEDNTSKEDPLYSTVCKERTRGINT
ncbi:hypothetical protein DPMN_067819 [Dreissena polymorpha]|uniref:Uncharacterized protein n=1 Tax=Dreissena polymorpha TaxID=45954 RepID=A0A9D3Z0G0_DREPO|nr:hypothetical protein DPMN_067819 [Dreissena polymorpha]